MKQKQRIALLGMVAVALIFAACGGDSGNNGAEVEGGNSSSGEISSSGGQLSGSSSSSDLSSVNTSSSSSIEALSSSLAISSSSANEQSSSSSVPSSSSAVDPSSVEYGSFSYGGQTYRTVKIGTQTWMAENLNYADSIAMPNLAGNSWCYGNSADSCAKYGRLYTWTAAMNLASSYLSEKASSVISSPHQGVCPTGWHVPSRSEWTTLETAVGGEETAGTKLKSTSGWTVHMGVDGNGTDVYGFSALPGGDYYGSGFDYVGYEGYWWTASEYSEYCSSLADYRFMHYVYTSGTSGGSKAYGRSLRCLED